MSGIGCELGSEHHDAQEVDPFLLKVRLASDNSDNCATDRSVPMQPLGQSRIRMRTLQAFFELGLLTDKLLLRRRLLLRARVCMLLLTLEVDPDIPIRHCSLRSGHCEQLS